MKMPESIQDYAQYAAATPQAIRHTLQNVTGFDEARTLLAHAQRIFFTGSGSSLPAALFGCQSLIRHSAKAGMFAPSSLLLDHIALPAPMW